MIKEGQIYKEKHIPYWRKNESAVFAITNISMNFIYTIDTNGKTDFVGCNWIKDDCKLIAEYSTWQQAVNSKEFKNGTTN